MNVKFSYFACIMLLAQFAYGQKTFINMHASHMLTEKDICMFCNAAECPSADDYYMNVLSKQSFRESCLTNEDFEMAPDADENKRLPSKDTETEPKYSAHLICEKCLHDELKTKGIFEIECPYCKNLVGYKCILEYIKWVAAREAKKKTVGEFSETLAIAMFRELTVDLGREPNLQTLVYSLGMKEKGEIEAFVDYFGKRQSLIGSDLYEALKDEAEQATKWLMPWGKEDMSPNIILSGEILCEAKNFPRVLYSKACLFPQTAYVDKDLGEHLRFFTGMRTTNHRNSTTEVAFVNAKIISILDQPEVPAKYICGYLLPYLLECSRFKNMVIRHYCAKYVDRIGGAYEKYEMILKNMIIHGKYMANHGYFSLASRFLAEVEHPVASAFNLFRRLCRLSQTAQIEDGPVAADIISKFASAFQSLMEKHPFGYFNIVQIHNLLKDFPKLKKTFGPLKLKYITVKYTADISKVIVDQLSYYACTENYAGMRELILLYEMPEKDKTRCFLFNQLSLLPHCSYIRAYSLLQFIEYEMVTGNINKTLQREMLLRRRIYSAYLYSITLYSVQQIILLGGFSFNSSDTSIRREILHSFTAMRNELSGKPVDNSDLLCAYAFAYTYNSYLRNFVENSTHYLVDLPFISPENCGQMYRFLINQFLISKNSAYSRALHMTISSISDLLAKNEIPTGLHLYETNIIVEKLVYSGLSPAMIRMRYLTTSHDFENILAYYYFEYCYCLRRSRTLKTDQNSVPSNAVPEATDADCANSVDSMVDFLIKKHSSLLLHSKSIRLEQLAEIVDEIMEKIIRLDRDPEIPKGSLSRVYPLVDLAVKRGAQEIARASGMYPLLPLGTEVLISLLHKKGAAYYSACPNLENSIIDPSATNQAPA